MSDEDALAMAYTMWDTNNSKKISEKEINSLFEKLGHKVDPQKIVDIITELSESSDLHISSIDYATFMKKMLSELAAHPEEKRNQMAFSVLDSDGDGFINGAELKKAMSLAAGAQVSSEEVEEMLLAVGKDGKISFDQFSKVVKPQSAQPNPAASRFSRAQ